MSTDIEVGDRVRRLGGNEHSATGLVLAVSEPYIWVDYAGNPGTRYADEFEVVEPDDIVYRNVYGIDPDNHSDLAVALAVTNHRLNSNWEAALATLEINRTKRTVKVIDRRSQ